MTKGKVLSIMDTNTVIISVGRENGIKLGAIFLIYEEISVNDPETGEFVETFPYRKGMVKVIQVNNKTSLAISNESIKTLNSLGKTIRFFSNESEADKLVDSLLYQTHNIPLNVDNNYIEPKLNSKKIRPGDLIILVEESPVKQIEKQEEVKLLAESKIKINFESTGESYIYSDFEKRCRVEINFDSEMVYISFFGRFHYKQDQVVDEFSVPVPLNIWTDLCSKINSINTQELKEEILPTAYMSKWEEQTKEPFNVELIDIIKEMMLVYKTGMDKNEL